MAKVTRTQLIQAKRLRAYTNRLASQNTKVISKVFLDFSKQIAKDNGYKFAENPAIKIIYAKFERAMKLALKQIFGKSVNSSADYVNTLFGWKLKEPVIKSVKNDVLKLWNEKNSSKMVKNITKSTKKTINKIITQSQKEGVNQREIIRRLTEKVEGMSKARARTIARTETSKAVNITTDNAARNAGMKFVTWVYTHISQVPREAHTLLDGTKIKITEFFNVNGHKAKHPHDPNLPPEEIINCECIAIYS